MSKPASRGHQSADCRCGVCSSYRTRSRHTLNRDTLWKLRFGDDNTHGTFGDNANANRIANGTAVNNRTRHTAIRERYINEKVTCGDIKITWIPTPDQAADMYVHKASASRPSMEACKDLRLCVYQSRLSHLSFWLQKKWQCFTCSYSSKTHGWYSIRYKSSISTSTSTSTIPRLYTVLLTGPLDTLTSRRRRALMETADKSGDGLVKNGWVELTNQWIT